MKVGKIAIYYPSGKAMMEMGPLEGTVNEITQIAKAGLEDIVGKLPDITSNFEQMYSAYERAKATGMKVESPV